MPDLRFYEKIGRLNVGEAARICGGALSSRADPARDIIAVSTIETPAAGALVFVERARNLDRLADCDIALCLAPVSAKDEIAPEAPLCLCPDPRLAFAEIAARLFAAREYLPQTGGPLIHPTAQISDDVQIAAGAVMGPDVEIGAGTMIGPNAMIGPGVRIGAASRIGAGAVISHMLAGARLNLAAGVKIGQEGFGFADGARPVRRLPQLGRVVLGDDVEIGANSTIDRGAIGDTVIGDGVKMDNLVQIGHNTRIGAHCLIAAQAGIAGSCEIGAHVRLGGQAGIADHIRIGDGAQIAAKAGIINDVGPGERWAGYPAQPAGPFFRQIALLKKLAREKRLKR